MGRTFWIPGRSTRTMKPILPAIALAVGLCAFPPVKARAGVLVTGITTSFLGNPINATADLTSVSTSDGSTTTDLLLAPTELSYSGSNPFTYRGTAGSGTPTITQSLLGLDVSTGVSSDHSAQTLNVLFPSAITGRVYLFDVSSSTSVESGFSMRAIVGGTVSSPVLGGIPLALPSAWGDTGKDLSGNFPAIPFLFTQNIVGYGVDVWELGVSSLVGLQLFAPVGADPSAIVAMSVPEPASAIVIGLFPWVGMLLRRRSARGQFVFPVSTTETPRHRDKGWAVLTCAPHFCP